MKYSLYDFYKSSSLDLYQVRKHYLEHFYYLNHGKNEANYILKSVVSSTKVGRLIEKSVQRKIIPSCENFLNVIHSMFKFIFRSDETIVLAVLDAALRWDIEVNQEIHLASKEELKQNIIQVFKKLKVNKEPSDEDYYAVVNTPTINAEVMEKSKKERLLFKHDSNQVTWSFIAFAEEFGKDVSVGKFARKSDGEIFYSCIFTNEEGHKTFVGFSSKLGVLTSEEIEQMKKELVVIKSSSGNYNLYKDNGRGWKKVKI